MEPTDLVSLTQDVVRSLQPEATRKSVWLRVAASTESVILDLDPVRMREVLTNVVANALAHNPSGSVVTLSVRKGTDGVAATVTDTGRGMPPEDVARMFDRFAKGSRIAWLGSGLDDRKGHRHGARRRNHRVESSRRGTTVTVTLPRSPAS